MAAFFSRDDLISLPNAALVSGDMSCSSQNTSITAGYEVCTDSRQVGVGLSLSMGGSMVYLAIKGERFDGHGFVYEAAIAGAAGAIISASQVEPVLARLQKYIDEDVRAASFFVIAVPDSLLAYQQLATLYRQIVKPIVVAVTGSSGKTTTKEMCAAVFEKARRLHKSALNENNEIGVPKTILSMALDTEILVLEMGMRGLGQIAELASCARPDIGIITGVGVAHIELLGSKENIARAKCELLPFLSPKNGVAILGQPDGLLVEEAQRTEGFIGKIMAFPQADFKIVTADATSTTFTFGQSSQKYKIHAHGSVLLQDAWCAVQAGLAAGLSEAEVADGLSQWRAVEGRGNAVGTNSGALLIDESYNSNPDSVRCAVEAILSSEAFPQKSKIVVLGEMLELGDFSNQLHEELGQWLRDKPITMLVTVGDQAARIAAGAGGAAFAILPLKDRDEAQAKLLDLMQKDCCVMVKGSHGTKLYELVKVLL